MVMPSDLCEAGVTLEFLSLQVQSLLHFLGRHLLCGSCQTEVGHSHHCGIILCVCGVCVWCVWGRGGEGGKVREL